MLASRGPFGVCVVPGGGSRRRTIASNKDWDKSKVGPFQPCAPSAHSVRPVMNSYSLRRCRLSNFAFFRHRPVNFFTLTNRYPGRREGLNLGFVISSPLPTGHSLFLRDKIQYQSDWMIPVSRHNPSQSSLASVSAVQTRLVHAPRFRSRGTPRISSLSSGMNVLFFISQRLVPVVHHIVDLPVVRLLQSS